MHVLLCFEGEYELSHVVACFATEEEAVAYDESTHSNVSEIQRHTLGEPYSLERV